MHTKNSQAINTNCEARKKLMYARRNNTDSQAHTHTHTYIVNSVSDNTIAVDRMYAEESKRKFRENKPGKKRN